MSFVYLKLATSNEPADSGFDGLGSVYAHYRSFRDSTTRTDGFVLNSTDVGECVEALRAIRSDPRECLKPVFMVHDTGALASTLADGVVANAAEARARFDRFLQHASSVLAQSDPDIPEMLLLRYLYIRPELVLTPRRDWQHPKIYHYPLVAALTQESAQEQRWLGNLRNRGLLEPLALMDRLRVCPECNDAHIGFIDVCPNCREINIAEEIFLHCYTCGNVTLQAEFIGDDGLSCPKCHTGLRHIGVDYDRALENFSCKLCRHLFPEPDVQARCHICDWSGESDRLVVRRVESLGLTEAGRLAVRSGSLGDFYSILDNLNYVNPSYFRYIADWCLRLARRHVDLPFALICVKLPNVAELIERIGHNRVMQMLDGLAERIKELIRTTDLATRTSDQLFWLLLPHTPEDGCRVVLSRLLDIQSLTRQEDGAELVIRGAYVCAPQGVGPGESAELLMGRLAGETR